MAELIAGDGKAPLALKGEAVLVGRHDEDGSFMPDIDLGGLEGGRTVSRRHAQIFRRNGQWFLRVESTTTNATLVGGRALTTGQEAELKDGEQILLGKIPLIFRANSEEPPVSPEPVLGPPRPTAELRADDRTYPLTAPDGGQLTLGRHPDDRTYQPDVDLGDLAYGRTVSRHHGLLSFRGGHWFLKVEAAVTNPTILNGTTLAQGQEVALNDNDQIQLGRVIATFHQIKQIPSVGPDQIELTVEPVQLTVEAGNEVRTTVTIVNHTGHVDWFRVEVEGIPANWYKIYLADGTEAQPAQVRLFHTPAHTATPSPDAVGQLKIYIRPPKDCQSWAGVHPFVVSATTQGEPRMRRATSCELTVGRFENFEITLQPDKITSPRGDFRVDLHNDGNDLATVDLETAGDGLIVQMDRQQVTLSNCAKDQVKLNARVKHRHWLGAEKTYPLGVKVKAGGYRDELVGYIICQPRIPYWLQLLFSRIQPILIPILMLAALAGVAFALLRPPDVKDFKADPASVIVGTPVSLSWTIDRAKSVSIDPSSGNEQLKPDSGALKLAPTATTKYTLTARNLVGISSSRSVNVEVRPAPQVPQIVSFTVSTDHIKKEGEAVTLDWKVDGATKVTIEPADEIKDAKASGEATVHPAKNNTVYKLTATNDAGSVDASKTIVIDPPQVSAFAASPETAVAGGEVRLRWTALNYTKLTIKADKGEVVPGKQEADVPPDATDQAVHPLETTQYTITATNAGGTDAKTVKVTVSPMQIAFFKAEPSSIAKGEQTLLSWNVVGATSITIQPDIGAAGQGQTSSIVKPDKTTEYTLTATGAGNKKLQAKTTITVGLGAVKIDFFTAAPASITKGDSATLTYSVQNAKHITIQGSDGSSVKDIAVTQPSVQGSVNVSPTKTTTYTLTATNDSGPTASPATITVLAPTPTPPPPTAPPAAPAPPSAPKSGG